MDDVTLSKEEQEELQAKLKEGAKNAQIFQNKVKYLQETVVNMMKRKAVAEEELIREKKTLKQKSEELDYMKKRLQETSDRLDASKKKAAHLRKLIKDTEGTFNDLIGSTRTLQTTAAYRCKEVETNHTGNELAAQRGYDCKAGSTMTVSAMKQATPRGFF